MNIFELLFFVCIVIRRVAACQQCLLLTRSNEADLSWSFTHQEDKHPKGINTSVRNPEGVGVTSSTLHGAVLPAAVRPDVKILGLLLLLAASFLTCVQRHCVFIVDAVALVMEEQHLRPDDTGKKQKKKKKKLKLSLMRFISFHLSPDHCFTTMPNGVIGCSAVSPALHGAAVCGLQSAQGKDSDSRISLLKGKNDRGRGVQVAWTRDIDIGWWP